MVLIKEYRIPIPFTLEEYRRGQLYMIAKASKEETNGSEGIEVLANEPYKDEKGEGIYTHKIIHLTSRLPVWVQKIFPFIGNALQIEEKSWNTFPYSKTEYKSPLFGDRCTVIVESLHVEDDGNSNNIHNVSHDVINIREIEYVDIRDDTNDHTNGDLADPKTFKSSKIKRGPLDENWTENKPIIYAYKLAYIECNIRGLRKKIEHMIADIICKIYLRTHRQAFVWMDEWIDLSLDEIRQIEEDTHQHINSKIQATKNETKEEVSQPRKSRKRGFMGKIMSKL